MTSESSKPSIVSTEEIFSGVPRIEGRRVSVLDILSGLETGDDIETIAAKYEIDEEEVKVAVDWLTEHPKKRYTLRLERLVQHDKSGGSASKPPISDYIEQNTFCSLQDTENLKGVALDPSRRYIRVYQDTLHESHSVYLINTVQNTANPIHDSGDLCLSDAIDIAVEYHEESKFLVADKVVQARSVRLDEIFSPE